MYATKKILTGLGVVLICLGFLAGCTPQNKKTAAKPALPAKQEQSTPTKNGKPIITKEQIIYRMPKDGSQFLLPEKVNIKTTAGSEALDTLKTLVGTKPTARLQAANAFPEKTRVLSVDVKDGIARANFSKEILQKGRGDYAQVMMIYSIVNTLTEMPSIKKVQILAEGKKIVVLGQMDLEDPLPRNTSFLRKAK